MDTLFADVAEGARTMPEEPEDEPEGMEPEDMEPGNGEEAPPHPLFMHLDEERGDPDLVEAMFDPDELETLKTALDASEMPYALFDAEQAMRSLLPSGEHYRRYAFNAMFVTMLAALYECYEYPLPGSNSYVKRAILSSMVMVRSPNGATMLATQQERKLSGRCSGNLGTLCQLYAMRNNVFIICFAARDEPPLIHTWCNPESAPFHWLFIDALCKSMQGVQPGPQLLDKEKILAQFVTMGQRTNDNESALMSLFNELD